MFASKKRDTHRKYDFYMNFSLPIAVTSALLKEGCSPDVMGLLKS